ncbi:pathway-specific regulatory protein [Penicillium frequentans]|uniref:Pathway-specific regulatory protein n=1 Tax=Penicillium frequentans TaxID=3151616 RepID=A0AAD6D666_9EURO|nr:pathway-specific regulatory protein [Penicillium glabrum]
MSNILKGPAYISARAGPANEQSGKSKTAISDGIDGEEPSQVDQHRGEPKQPIATIPTKYHGMIYELYEAIQQADQAREQELFSQIPDGKTAQQVRVFLYGMLANARLAEMNDEIAGRSINSLSGMEMEMEGDLPRARPRVLDIQYLCEVAPVRVPARPWTTVTDSDDLVSHLVSLYLTWGYPFYAFFCVDTFVKHMQIGHLQSDFCSPFLVNALLANACFYSDYTEAYSLPGDVKRKGAHFLAEAESYLKSHQTDGRGDIRLASLQASLLLYERYSLSGYDNYGYTMLHRAIGMAESIGIVNSTRMLNLGAPHLTIDMKRSLQRTAWGLFQIDTIVHMNFLKRSQIKIVNLDRISRDETLPQEVWTPYPKKGHRRQSHMSQYFDEACRLSFIARDASWNILRNDDGSIKRELYRRLCEWEEALPSTLKQIEDPAPYILILSHIDDASWNRMRYHTLVINLCYHDLESDMLTGTTDLDSTSSDGDFNPQKIAVCSAREIAFLIRKFGTDYGLEYSHQFAMYAINVSLFCLLAQKDFDIRDPDFLSLTEGFSIVACRSQVGRHLFRAFKITIRSRSQAGLIKSPDDVSPGIRELLGARKDYIELDKWDHHAECLAEVEGERSFIRDIGVDPTVPGLHQMLKWYEHLSLGEETQWRKNHASVF